MAKTIAVEIKKLFDEQKKKGEMAQIIAMNITIKEVKEELVNVMKKVFDNPTPYTLNSLFIVPAKKGKIVVRIGIKDFAGKGTPASKYLSPQIEGGARAAKSTERRLREIGKLNPNRFAVPGSGIKLNKYGNVSGSKMVQILSAAKAFTDAGYDANVTAGSKKRNPNAHKYFVIHDGAKSHLKPGVYYRAGGKRNSTLKPMLMFTQSPKYEKRFHFFELSNQYFNEKLNHNVNKTMNKISKGTP